MPSMARGRHCTAACAPPASKAWPTAGCARAKAAASATAAPASHRPNCTASRSTWSTCATSFARERGAALRAMSYGERAALLAKIGELLQSKRDDYYAIATANSGTTRNDSAIDIDGAIYTLGQYARWGAKLGDARALHDGEAVSR